MPFQRGVRAKCSVLVKFLHPTELVKSVITNATKAQKTFDLIIVRKEEKVVNWRKQTVILLSFDDTNWKKKEVYCCERYTTVLKVGDAADFFINTSANDRGSDQPAEFEGTPVPENLQHLATRRISPI